LNPKQTTKTKTILQLKEWLTPIKHFISRWWQQLYSSKCHSLGLQAQSDVAREVLPTRVTRGNCRTLGESWGWFLFLALQTTCNSKQPVMRPQLIVVVVKHQQLART
jgi:hypothetical protein